MSSSCTCRTHQHGPGVEVKGGEGLWGPDRVGFGLKSEAAW